MKESIIAAAGSLLRLIPAGKAIFGSSSEQIEYAHCLDKESELFWLENERPQFEGFLPTYYIGVYAVTNEQFARFLSETHPSAADLRFWMPWPDRICSPRDAHTPYTAVAGYERHPVTNLSWFGAQAYCTWSALRLPTELEWEKAARGTDGRVFPWGNEWSPGRLCWRGSHFESQDTVLVDSFETGCSPFGIFQMAGNVAEWCADWYDPHIYSCYAADALAPPKHGLERVVRGGSCRRRNKLEFRCAIRRGNRPLFVNTVLTGLRCAGDVR